MKFVELSWLDFKVVLQLGILVFFLCVVYDSAAGVVDVVRSLGTATGAAVFGFVFVVWRKSVKSFEEKRGESNGRTTRKI